MSIKETLERFDEKKFKIYDTYNNDFRCINDDPLSDDIKQFITEELKKAMEEVKLKDKTFPEIESDDFDKGYAKAVEDFNSNVNKYFEV